MRKSQLVNTTADAKTSPFIVSINLYRDKKNKEIKSLTTYHYYSEKMFVLSKPDTEAFFGLDTITDENFDDMKTYLQEFVKEDIVVTTYVNFKNLENQSKTDKS